MADASITKTNQYFEQHAEPERIANDKLRKECYEAIRKPTDSEASVEKYISDTARYWSDYTIDDQTIYAMWQGITADDRVMNPFFTEILPKHNLAHGIEQVTLPVILLAGERDYDSIPLVQWQNYPKPAQFTIINCGAVGHWPSLENPSMFDSAIKKWLENANLINITKH